jgi:16S rRNA (cytidine1402-2'-O)-methyltransferase
MSLFIVATPLGNLEDISKRALRILSEVDLILCEDTRVTKKLLEHYNIKTPTLSYHQHSQLRKVEYIIQLLKEGKNLALVSDAGTPGVSDPGNQLVSRLVDEFVSNALTIVPIPGPSALTTAASIAGLPMDRFLFLGFPPMKKKRKRFFEEIVNSKYPVLFYESPHRVIKSLTELTMMDEKLDVVVCRELTKKFETIYRGKIKEVLGRLEKEQPRGEFVIVVKGRKER